LSLIADSLQQQKLGFTETQIQILAMQAKQLEDTKGHFQQAEAQHIELLRLHEEEKRQHMAVIAELKKYEIDSITVQSSLKSSENQLGRKI
jgi:hypothetical protein